MMDVSDIRTHFLKTFDPTLPIQEIIGASFRANADSIFLKPNEDYIMREIDWYLSRSLDVNSFPGGAPTIWKQVASEDGLINSNYGFLFYDPDNGSQFEGVVNQLVTESHETGRRATAVYTRPTIHWDYNRNGMQDFICTNAVNYYARDGRIHAVVQMRSNDVVYGYRNDYAWQVFALMNVVDEVNYRIGHQKFVAGEITWQAGSLHIYPRHYDHLMRIILEGLLIDAGQEKSCLKKTVVAKLDCDIYNHEARNGGIRPCLREKPGHVPEADYSDCPYPHAEPQVFRDVALTRCDRPHGGLWITSPPCLKCCEVILQQMPKFVVWGHRQLSDGHLPIQEIKDTLERGGIPTWQVSLDK